jgi:hypothetical protein
LKKLGYINDKSLIRFTGEETTPKLEDDDIMVFKSFFWVGLRLLMYKMIIEVLHKYEIYMYQWTLNAIVRLNIFIWAMQSQGACVDAEAFCRVHELHYQTKARPSDKLHNNFGCYNLSYHKDSRFYVLAYRIKWPSEWAKEWFYAKANTKKREEFKDIVMRPLKLSFD